MTYLNDSAYEVNKKLFLWEGNGSGSSLICEGEGKNASFEILKEIIGGKEIERFRISGLIQKADTLNQNGRIYPIAILEREVRNYQRLIKEKRAFGCIDHPDSLVVEFKDSSHAFTKVWMEGKNVYGTIELLNNDNGRNMRSVFEQGFRIGISSRGAGSVSYEDGAYIVQDDYVIVCWDLVTEPSTTGAFMDHRVQEGLVHRTPYPKNPIARQMTLKESVDLDKFLGGKDYRINRAINDILIIK